jgi:HEAT repeat protein
MRPAFAALCLAALCAGCTSSPVADKTPADGKPLERPVAAVAANPSFGEDADGKPVPAAALDAARASLNDPDPAVRHTALKNLDKVRWKAAEPVGGVLAMALKDVDTDIRLDAIRVAAAQAPHVLDPELLRDDAPRVRVAAARALVALGKHEQPAYLALGELLHDSQYEGRKAILELIGEKAPASRPAAPALVALAFDAKDPLRLEAIDVLARLGPAQEAVDALLILAHGGEPNGRAAALKALGRHDAASVKVQAALLKGLRDPNVDIRLAATEGVGRDGVPTLIELLRHGDERLRDASARALCRLGPDAWAAGSELQRVAQSDPAERVRQSAKAALKTIVPQ